MLLLDLVNNHIGNITTHPLGWGKWGDGGLDLGVGWGWKWL